MPATSMMIVVTTLAAHVVSTCLCPPMSGVYIRTYTYMFGHAAGCERSWPVAGDVPEDAKACSSDI